jgi:EpsI family protein
MIGRLLVTSALLLAGAGYVAHAMEEERVPPRDSLTHLPLRLPGWEGRDAPAFDPKIVQVLGVDEYVNRLYVDRNSTVMSLYVGFYESQRQGDTMHSPLNCLPGAGWQAVRQDRVTLQVRGADGAPVAVKVNQFVIQKGLSRQLVLYWYQSHGRVIASEYTSKLYMVYDAMRLNRTDGAMVRVITPIRDRGEEAAAAGVANAFVQQLFPSLSRLLPS